MPKLAKNLTLYISADLAEKMNALEEVNWSQVARESIQRYVDERLNPAIPAEILSRLRKEMGDEYTNGKKLATESMVPFITYRKLEAFFTKTYSVASKNLEAEAREMGISPDELSLDVENAGASIIKDYFSEIPKDASSRFCKGVFLVFNELWENIQK
jgi:hypothetical protein